MRLIDADNFKKYLLEKLGPSQDSTVFFLYGLIAEQPTVKQDNWIPCSERLPEESGAYLVTIGGKYTHGYMGTKIDLNIFHHKIKKWKTRNDFVVAWKPLPQPFKEADSK